MTDQEIQIAIAEACGIPRELIDKWVDYELAERQFQCAEISTDEFYQRHLRLEPNCVPKVPNYPKDLNAMNEAEDKLTFPAINRYCGTLYKLCGEDMTEAVHATARQRSEAFLRTIGKWKE